MGSVVKAVKKAAKQTVNQIGRTVEDVGNVKKWGSEAANVAVQGATGGLVGVDKDFKTKSGVVTKELERSNVGKAALHLYTGGMYGAVKTGQAIAKGNSADVFNSIQDWGTMGASHMADQWTGDDGRKVLGYGSAVAASFIPYVGLGVSAALIAAEQARQGGVQKQEGKALAKEQEAEAAAYEAKQKRLANQADFISSIYSQGSESVASNAYYDTYRRYSGGNHNNASKYGYF